MTWLTSLSLKHRRIVALLSIALIAVGVFLAPSLRQQLIPDMQFPVVSITAQYPGAAPDVVESEVTKPIEDAVSDIDDASSVTSTSNQGSASVQVQFDFGQDLDKARSDISAAVSSIQDLPSTASADVVSGSTSDQPVVVLSATTNGDIDSLGSTMEEDVVPKLKSVDDVNDVQLTGVQEKQIKVVPDSDELAKSGLSASDVTDALSSLSETSSAGVLDSDGMTMSIGVGQAASSLHDVRDIWLTGKSDSGTNAVQLDEVADVTLQDAPQTTITRTDGKPSLGIDVTMVQNGSATTVSDGVQDTIKDVEDSLPAGTDLTVVSDSGPPVQESVKGLLIEGLIGLVMAIAVILLFLRSGMSTIVTAISIPTSLIIALVALWARDDSLNLLTLGGLTIAIGRVVDDSIVVLENIKRHLSFGEPRKTAIMNAVREVSSAVVSSTLTTVAVFVPIVLLGGFVGEIFAPFAIAVGAAMLGSLLIALTVVPTLAYWFLRADPVPEGVSVAEHRDAAEKKERRGLLQRVYRPVLVWALAKKGIIVSLAAALLIGTVFLATQLKTNFLGDTGESTITVSQTLPDGTDLKETNSSAKKVEKAIESTDGVDNYQAAISGGSVEYTIVTDPDIELAGIQKDLDGQFDQLTDVGDVVVNVAGSVGSDAITVELQGEGHALSDADTKVVEALRDLPEISDVSSGLSTGFPAISITAKGEKAAEKGLNDETLSQMVAGTVQGSTVNEIPIDGEQTQVVVQTGTAPTSLEDLKDLKITTPTGSEVKLSDVADIKQITTPTSVHRTDGEPTDTVSVTPEGDNTGAATTAIESALDSIDLPQGVTYTLGGASEQQSEGFQTLIVAMIAAVALVLLVLLGVFRSFAQTGILLMSIPFAFTGGFAALFLTGTPLGIASLIGLLMLIGIVVTNAIVLMDRVNQHRVDGMSVREAVINGGLRRLRPILMTALATMAALVPMALGITGAGGFISTPLAVVVIGGLFTSTLLTLVLIPVLYTWIEEARERRHTRRKRRGTKKAKARHEA